MKMNYKHAKDSNWKRCFQMGIIIAIKTKIKGNESMVTIKRVYDPYSKSDGRRILVDRLWPRNLTRQKAKIHLWMKDIAPSNELRKWFGHDPQKWLEFKRRYLQELKQKKDLLKQIRGMAEDGRVTLVYGARDKEHNNARVLQEFFENGDTGI